MLGIPGCLHSFYFVKIKKEVSYSCSLCSTIMLQISKVMPRVFHNSRWYSLEVKIRVYRTWYCFQY